MYCSCTWIHCARIAFGLLHVYAFWFHVSFFFFLFFQRVRIVTALFMHMDSLCKSCIWRIVRLRFWFHIFFYFFFIFSAHMNNNYTVHAHGFTVQELRLAYCASTFLVSLFFFSTRMNSNYTFHAHGFIVQETKCTVHKTYNHFVQKTNIKNWYHGTIHSFKNYFVTVFLVFSFQFLSK